MTDETDVSNGQRLAALIEAEELARIEMTRMESSITFEMWSQLGQLTVASHKAKMDPEYVEVATRWAKAYAQRRGFEKDINIKENSSRY